MIFVDTFARRPRGVDLTLLEVRSAEPTAVGPRCHAWAAKAPAHLVVGFALSILVSGCKFGAPRCDSGEIVAGIERDARASVELWMDPTSDKRDAFEQMPFRVVDSYTAASDGNRRSCSVSIKIGASPDEVSVPIEYEVIRTDAGQTMYRWDSSAFGKAVIDTELINSLSQSAPATSAATAVEHHVEIDKSPQAIGRWKDRVTATILAAVGDDPNIPSGSLKVRVLIDSSGRIVDVQTVAPIENAEMATDVVRIIKGMGLVSKPPGQTARWIYVPLHFF